MFARKFHPRKELQCYAIIFCILGAFFIASLLLSIPGYSYFLQCRAVSASQVTIPASVDESLLALLRTFFFRVFPAFGIVMLSGWRVWRAAKYVSHTHDNKSG
jgi:hypothetical protein